MQRKQAHINMHTWRARSNKDSNTLEHLSASLICLIHCRTAAVVDSAQIKWRATKRRRKKWHRDFFLSYVLSHRCKHLQQQQQQAQSQLLSLQCLWTSNKMRIRWANQEKKHLKHFLFFTVSVSLSLSLGQQANTTQIITESGAWCASSSQALRPIVSYQRTATAYSTAQYSPIQRTLHAIIILSNYKRLLILIILLISFFLFALAVFAAHVRNDHYFIASFSAFHRVCVLFSVLSCATCRLWLDVKVFFLLLLLPSQVVVIFFRVFFYLLWFFSGKISVSPKRYINSTTKVP